jgi:hypothetical protein
MLDGASGVLADQLDWRPSSSAGLPVGVWTGSVAGPMASWDAEFVVGRSDGRTTLLLRPNGPPPVEASEVRSDGERLDFAFDAGGRKLFCRLTKDATRSLAGDCGESPDETGPFHVRMVPPRSEHGS